MKYALLRSVAQDIVNGTLKFSMVEWCDTPWVDRVDEHGEIVFRDAEQTACGTIACIAGWVAIRGETATLYQRIDGKWIYRVAPDLVDAADDEAYEAWSYAALIALNVDIMEDGYFFDHTLFHMSNPEALDVLRTVADTEHMTVNELRELVYRVEAEHAELDD